MKKRNLLAIAALSCFAFSANAELEVLGDGYKPTKEFWVIKDGKLTNGIKIMDNTKDAVYDVLEEGDATTGASYKHKENLYKDVQFDLSEIPVSLKSTWVLEMEYKVPASALDQTGEHVGDLWGTAKRPMFIFAMYPEKEVNGTAVTFECNAADARVDIDAKFTAQADTWTTVRKYVYANPSLDSCKVLTLGYCREVKVAMDPIYIKNLRFIDCGGQEKPFYAEDFQGVGSKRVPVHGPGDDNFGKKKATQLAGGIQFESANGGLISVKRCYEEEGHDGSWFMDTENYQALKVPAGGADIIAAGITIPAEIAANGGNIYFKAYMKNEWESGTTFPTATDEQRVIPATIKFNNGTEVQITDSLMDGQWDAINSTIAVPAGATSFDLVFKSNSDYTYLVDNIRIGTYTGGDNVATIASDIEIEITPNPASDIITVSGDVEKIEVIALNGAVVASAEGNQANIAALAAGSYIVKAYTAEGIAIKMIIKK